MRTIKFKQVFQILSIVSLCLILCACQAGVIPGDDYPMESDEPYFTYGPGFYVPLELLGGTAKTPEQVLEEQSIDDTHDAFLVDTGGELGTLLITVEAEESNESTYLRLILHFSVWEPAHMDTPLQTMTADSACFHCRV